MLNGEKAISFAAPHYALLTVGKPENVTLPPISSYVGLTEKNLNSLNSLNRFATTSSTSLPLLTSLLALELPLLLPRMASHDHYKMSYDARATSVSSSISVDSNSVSSSAATAACKFSAVNLAGDLAGDLSPNDSPKKRRQRLGPSCDNCRARKVKCNAEVIMLSRHFSPTVVHQNSQNDSDSYVEEFASLLPELQLSVLAGSLVAVGNYTLVLSKSKLIKFKACLSCAGKGLECCFSKGFTKEDIVYSKRSGPETVPVVMERKTAVKVMKKRVESSGSTRKSSCAACRKRKVKCVMHNRLNKCIGCMKKDSTCSFEV